MLKTLLALLNRKAKANRGFTLIELLVVVAIIGLLATFALPRVFEAINKAKGGVGVSDLNTIASGMERYYFDHSKYPNGENWNDVNSDGIKDAAEVTALPAPDALKGDYLKASTTFVNGFKKGYILFTDNEGSYYVLVDPGNNTAAFSVTCGSSATPWTATVSTATTFSATGAFQLKKTDGASAAPSKTQMTAGCKITSTVTSFDLKQTSLVTN